MKVNLKSLEQRAGWEKAGVRLPQFDVAAMRESTKNAPVWVHFGAGNIFRAFIAALQQRLLDQGETDKGIIAADTFDVDNIRMIYGGYDNLTMSVTLNADATIDKEIIASVAEALVAKPSESADYARMQAIFAAPTLQMASFTITEKGYALRQIDGSYLPVVAEDLQSGPAAPRHAMTIVTALLYHRYENGKAPLAVVSMDNCSHNGEKLQSSIVEVAKAWQEKGFVPADFVRWLTDEKQVSFPWSMIDKITPRPAPAVQQMLTDAGIEEMAPIQTPHGTFVAPFVNAEKPQYLVVEDLFPNGRPPLEKAGVYFTDRNTVNETERMKVTTCLNPLHTALAVYGCLLGYTLICDEMKDADLVRLVRRLGYVEGLPVVTDPKILSPKAFIDEVVEQRLPNPFMPDAPQRIATDTSQKVGIRFGETIKSYVASGRSMDGLVALPLAIAGWLRYLLGVDDEGREMPLSSDPLLADLQKQLAGIALGRPDTVGDKLRPILQNALIFGSDLTKLPLGARITQYFLEEIAGPGAVRSTLKKYLAEA
ncbi:MAG: mannitol dehydrogenase family protein [Clostridia bacterium]|nr:mannitol dehydrogenase family protein [Clostridia bacterium]